MPQSVHIDRELLRGVAKGELPLALLTKLGLEHLLSVCPHCRRELQAFQRENSTKREENLSGLLHNVLKRHVAGLRREHLVAEKDLAELLALPAEARFEKVRRARRRFRGLHLAQLILEKCEESFTACPREARQLAELARVVIQCSPLVEGAFGVLALAAAHLANACRAGGHLREADAHYDHVRYLVNQYSITDAAILARIADFESSLRKDQRLFAGAEALLRRSLTLYHAGGGVQDVARVLLNLGDLFFVQGLPSKAIAATQEALRHLDAESQPQLYLMGRYNLTLQLTELGEPDQATDLLAADEGLYQRSPSPWTQLRLLCVRAKIAAGFGELGRAADLFGLARDGFIRQGIGYDAAIVSLEMASLYLRQGRHAEIGALAEAMVVIFDAQDVHREALAALVLFQQAARAEVVTTTLLNELRAYFRTARHDADYRFCPSTS